MTAIVGPLLPANATAFERAFEAIGAARYPLPVDLVRDVWDPDTCPAPLLGYLAWSLSVDLWDEAWPELKKREVCRKALWLHRIKTTPEGIRAHVKLVDAEVVKIIRPPAREHMRRSITRAEREAWLDRLPQVRIYPFHERATGRVAHAFASRPARLAFLAEKAAPGVFGIEDQGGLPIGGYTSARGRLAQRRFVVHTRGFRLYRRRATWIDPATGLPEAEAAVSISADGLTEQVSIRTTAGPRRFFGHAFAGSGYLLRSRADFSLLTVRIADAASSIMVTPGARPADVLPRRVAIRRAAQGGRAFFARAFLTTAAITAVPAPRRSEGPRLVYDRIAVAVPGRFHPRLKASAFAGRGRFGLPAFSAEMRIRVPMSRPAPLANRWHGHGWAKPANMTPFWRAIEAVRVSKALRDTIHVTTTTTRRAEFGLGLRFGDFDFGQMRKVS